MEHDQLLLDAIECAHLAGKIQLEHFRTAHLNATAKLNDSDIVTVADKLSEAAIIDFVHAHYPEHSILSEESGEEKRESEYEWVIDPVDGTTNYNAGLPMHCVSIGIRHRGETVVGVVLAPYLNELFHAVRGEGAYLNGKRIRVTANTDLGKAVVSTGFPVDKDTNSDNNMDNVARVLPRVRGLRRLGSAAIDICYVAAGFLDAYWELNLHEWDVCAGLLIAEEAGAQVVHFRTDRNVSVLVGAKAIAEEIMPLLNREAAE
ncbi:MAG: inositol monophosphatase family protein [Muribaculaceae bacterium]